MPKHDDGQVANYAFTVEELRRILSALEFALHSTTFPRAHLREEAVALRKVRAKLYSYLVGKTPA